MTQDHTRDQAPADRRPGSGAGDAFAAFVSARSPALLATARLLTGDRGRAEDLVQESLARTWLAWHRLERQDRVEAYTRRTMVNLSVSWWRRHRYRERLRDTVPEPAGAASGRLGDPAGPADLRDAFRRALADLPARQRAVIVLRYAEDWTEAQTAQTLGCTVGTVKSQAARAIARLREHPGITEAFGLPATPLRGKR